MAKKTKPKNKKSSVKRPKKKEARQKAKLPAWVKLISVIYFISAIIAVLTAIGVLTGNQLLKEIAESYSSSSQASGTAFAATLLISAIIEFCVGRGLWKKQKWARIVAIIIAVLGVIGALMTLQTGGEWIVRMMIHTIIGAYLIFSKQVKAAFN